MPDKVIPGVYFSNLVCETLVMVALYTVFVTVLFFTFGKYIETSVAKNNSDLLVDSLTDDINFFGTNLAPNEFQKISELLKNLKPPNMDKEDQDVNDQNMKLIKNTMFYVLIGALSAILVGLILWVVLLRRPIKQYFTFIFPHALILLGFVALVEIIFFITISKNYRSLDPNVAKKAIMDTIIDKIQNN
jgi:hypothetical protein